MIQALEILISRGHGTLDQLKRGYTLEQLEKMIEAAERNRKRELAELLLVVRVGYHGTKDDVKKLMGEFNRGQPEPPEKPMSPAGAARLAAVLAGGLKRKAGSDGRD